MGDWDAEAVRARLREKAARTHWSEGQRYELNPPLPEARIRAFEQEHGIRLRGRGADPRHAHPLEQGCGMYSRLILNGPYAGEVWWLDPDRGGLVPTSPDFRTWYTDWLEG
ncbi:hypothetical protein ACFWSF_14130 [Streptomyces sp. NPDC058611]|uniref:hypothetical protein n=1 Tax=unclassified Streptomyces TaxID=2593676 RepID=UPI003656E203